VSIGRAAVYHRGVRDIDASTAGGKLHPGEIHVWYVGLGHALVDAGSCLDADEVRRADRFHRERDRRNFRAAHCAFRHIIAAYLDCAPGAVRFCRRCARCGHPAHGKPLVVSGRGRSLEVSLSHSDELAAVAACLPPLVVGVDLERVRAGMDWASILPGASVASGADELDGFRSWTRLEAVVKAAGIGLLDLPRLADGPGDGGIDGWSTARVPGSARTWSVRSLAAPEGFSAALAASEPPAQGVRAGWWSGRSAGGSDDGLEGKCG
jgi:4'-phosphopantetheinyl transferase